MKPKQFDTPILFLIFNRPDTTERVFAQIRKVKPTTLYVAADGPRPHRPGETELCRATRAVLDKIDWKCKLHTRLSKDNQGCRVAVSSGISWFFSKVKEGIILEDDCVPNESFFKFCQSLLAHYRDDERIMHICGVNLQDGIKRGQGSYYFSRMSHVWGWATWQRAWKKYDVDIPSFPHLLEQNAFASMFPDPDMRRYWIRSFNLVFTKQRDTWDYQWQYAMSVNNGLAVLPNRNLVSNIGFGSGATHTIDSFHKLGNRATVESGDIIHPEFVVPDLEADRFSFRRYTNPNKFRKLWQLARRTFS